LLLAGEILVKYFLDVTKNDNDGFWCVKLTLKSGGERIKCPKGGGAKKIVLGKNRRGILSLA
jgi:hypothetical protein